MSSINYELVPAAVSIKQPQVATAAASSLLSTVLQRSKRLEDAVSGPSILHMHPLRCLGMLGFQAAQLQHGIQAILTQAAQGFRCTLTDCDLAVLEFWTLNVKSSQEWQEFARSHRKKGHENNLSGDHRNEWINDVNLM